MTTYSVLVPKPKARRMESDVKLIITLHRGWEGDSREEVVLQDFGEYKFEVPDRYEWLGTTSVSDGDSFDVKVEFKNSTGSRKEVYYLCPERI